MKLVSIFNDILDAAWEGYRNCESDAKDEVEGAAATMKKYGDALDPKKIVAIKRVLRLYDRAMVESESVSVENLKAAEEFLKKI